MDPATFMLTVFLTSPTTGRLNMVFRDDVQNTWSSYHECVYEGMRIKKKLGKFAAALMLGGTVGTQLGYTCKRVGGRPKLVIPRTGGKVM